MKRFAAMVPAAAVALATAGCATHYQAGGTASGGIVTSYSAFSLSASSGGASASFGAPLPNAGIVNPAIGNSGVSNASGVQVSANNGAAVVIAVGLSLLNSLQQQTFGRDGASMRTTRAWPFDRLSPETGTTLTWSDRRRAPESDPGRRVREVDCSRPFERDGANIMCR